MKNQLRSLIIFSVAAVGALCIGSGNARAQGGPPQGRFDMQQMRQRMMQNLREQMEVKDEAEWGAISNRIAKVQEAARGLGGPGGGFMGPPGGMPPMRGQQGGGPQDGQRPPDFGGPPPGNEGGGPPGAGAGGPGGPGGPGFNREQMPELDALRDAIKNKASNSELKAKLADLKEARARKKAELEKKRAAHEAAQEELRQVLSVRQEAVASTFGLL